MIVLFQLIISTIVTALVWLCGTALSFLIYLTFYSPEKLKAAVAAVETGQSLRSALTAVASDPAFLGAAILIAAVIILYDKLMMFALITIWDREDQQNSKT